MPLRKNKRSAPKNDDKSSRKIKKTRRSKPARDTDDDIPISPALPAHTPPSKNTSVPVDWDPMDIAMWNATPDDNAEWRPVHSSSSPLAQCSNGKGISMELFPELLEDSDSEDEDREKEREDESSPMARRSSPATSPPTAKKVTPQNTKRSNRHKEHETPEQATEQGDQTSPSPLDRPSTSRKHLLEMTGRNSEGTPSTASRVMQAKSVMGSRKAEVEKLRVYRCSMCYEVRDKKKLTILTCCHKYCSVCLDPGTDRYDNCNICLESEEGWRLCRTLMEDKDASGKKEGLMAESGHSCPPSTSQPKKRSSFRPWLTWTRRSQILRLVCTYRTHLAASSASGLSGTSNVKVDLRKTYPFTPPLQPDSRTFYRSQGLDSDVRKTHIMMHLQTYPFEWPADLESRHLHEQTNVTLSQPDADPKTNDIVTRAYPTAWTRRSATVRLSCTYRTSSTYHSPTNAESEPTKRYPFTPPLQFDQRRFIPSYGLEWDIDRTCDTMDVQTYPNGSLCVFEALLLDREEAVRKHQAGD